MEPVTILFNLYEFFRVLINFAEYYEKNTTYRPLTTIRSFSFKWQLHIHQRGEDQREQVSLEYCVPRNHSLNLKKQKTKKI